MKCKDDQWIDLDTCTLYDEDSTQRTNIKRIVAKNYLSYRGQVSMSDTLGMGKMSHLSYRGVKYQFKILHVG
jgi:hypothetical protein